MGRLRLVIPLVLAAMGLGACSSGHKATVSATTTTAFSTVPDTTTTTELPPTTAATTIAPHTTTSTTVQSSVRISGFSVSPARPVCNAPTMIQLEWTAVGAASVDLSIDGKAFASYGGGSQSHLEYYACDGKPHTYLLTARSGSTTATASRVVSSTSG